jgi:hypothetical protein
LRYYSVRAFSTESLQYEEPLILIEPGLNAFTVLTDDMEVLVERLKADGVRVDEVQVLDGDDTHYRVDG